MTADERRAYERAKKCNQRRQKYAARVEPVKNGRPKGCKAETKQPARREPKPPTHPHRREKPLHPAFVAVIIAAYERETDPIVRARIRANNPDIWKVG